jgi:hypothetical protein
MGDAAVATTVPSSGQRDACTRSRFRRGKGGDVTADSVENVEWRESIGSRTTLALDTRTLGRSLRGDATRASIGLSLWVVRLWQVVGFWD